MDRGGNHLYSAGNTYELPRGDFPMFLSAILDRDGMPIF